MGVDIPQMGTCSTQLMPEKFSFFWDEVLLSVFCVQRILLKVFGAGVSMVAVFSVAVKTFFCYSFSL